MEFYVKNEAGEFVSGDAEVQEYAENYLREKSDAIVSSRISRFKKQEASKIREELTEQLRQELGKAAEEEAAAKLKADYDQKLSEAEAKTTHLETELRRKNIAAEYGLKADLEQFLGDGDEESMRGKADILKATAGAAKATFPEKKSTTDSSSFVTMVNS